MQLCINFRIVFILLILYGFAMLPFTYVMSFLFGEPSVGFVWLSVTCIVTGERSQERSVRFIENLSANHRSDIADLNIAIFRIDIASFK